MRTICAVHYISLPGGGLATPGEILEPEVAARFTDAQIERMTRLGAIMVDEGYEPARPEIEAPENHEEEAPGVSPEVDAMDGIVTEAAPKKARRRK